MEIELQLKFEDFKVIALKWGITNYEEIINKIQDSSKLLEEYLVKYEVRDDAVEEITSSLRTIITNDEIKHEEILSVDENEDENNNMTPGI